MELGQLADVGEFLGGVAVIVSLVYLAAQIRQNTRQLEHNSELVRASAELETARLMADWHATIATAPDIVRIWGAHMSEGATALTAEERARFVWVIAQYFTIVEGLYRQRQRGFLAEDSWLPYEKTMSGLLRKPLVAEFITSSTGAFSGDFRELCSRLIESPRAN